MILLDDLETEDVDAIPSHIINKLQILGFLQILVGITCCILSVIIFLLVIKSRTNVEVWIMIIDFFILVWGGLFAWNSIMMFQGARNYPIQKEKLFKALQYQPVFWISMIVGVLFIFIANY